MTCTNADSSSPCVALTYANDENGEATPTCDAFGCALETVTTRRGAHVQRCDDCVFRFAEPDQGSIALLIVRRGKGA